MPLGDNVSESYKSNFLKNDKVAEEILERNTYSLDLNLYNLEKGEINTSSFEFKLINVFKYLGYMNLDDSRSLSLTLLNSYQERNNLPLSSQVDRKTMLMLDKMVYEREQYDLNTAKKYPPYYKFLDSPMNEPSKEHLATLFYDFFTSIPDGSMIYQGWIYSDDSSTKYINISTIFSEKDFLVGVLPVGGNYWGTLLDFNTLKKLDYHEISRLVESENYLFWFCGDKYYAQIKSGENFDECRVSEVVYRGGVISDFLYVYTLAHEFAHLIGNSKLDGEIYDTHCQFGQISFDLPEGGYYYGEFKRPEDDGEFISKYAKANAAEDFAESFSAYILFGNIFRERAKNNFYLKQKYDFLRDNIFGGVEYDTGNLESYEFWLSTKGNVLPYFAHGYITSDPRGIWDYNYIRL